jgi:hypothetical protein
MHPRRAILKPQDEKVLMALRLKIVEWKVKGDPLTSPPWRAYVGKTLVTPSILRLEAAGKIAVGPITNIFQPFIHVFDEDETKL